MKYILIIVLMSMGQYAIAQKVPHNMTVAKADKHENKMEENWVGVLWRESEKPIVMPILADSEKECMDMVTAMNNITKETVKINRNVTCQKVMVK